ncbi:MAG: flippase-like domain-containing protein [Candidatus Rokubacteria bacterium]|nr:flippase-like domain-containing protein [Candidatus Rokubacteria bacterium]
MVYLLRSVDFAELGRQLRATQWGWAAIATGLAPAGIWARAVRWRYLFPPRSEPPGLVAATMIGYMANNVLPLRAGEFVRVYVVARRWGAAAAGAAGRGHGFWTTLATLFVERVLDSLFIVAMLAALVLVIPVPAVLQYAAAVLLAVDCLGIAIMVGLVVAPEACQRLIARLLGRWPALRARAHRVFDTFVHGLEGIRTWDHALPILLWTGIVWAIPALSAWTMLYAMNFHLPWLAGLTVLVFVGLGVSIPSAPGYVGVFHAAAALAVGLYGVAQSAAIGYALVFHASQIVPVTLLGWLYLLREHVSLGEATHARVPPAEGA